MGNKFKENGFTLIELLAIIVILAVIAVITVPIILNIIESSRKGAATASAHGYKDAIYKYYAQELSHNNNLRLQGEYTVNDGLLDGDGFSDVEIPISGDVPTSGILNYSNNVLSNGWLIINGYKIIFNSDGTVITINHNNVDEQKRVAFQNDSWSDIVTNLTEDRDYYPVGAEKIVSMNLDGTDRDYRLRLVNTTSCSSTYEGSKTSCGVVIEFVTTVGTHVMNLTGTNAGGWYASDMRKYLNTALDSNNNPVSVYSKLPNDLRSVIISTNPVISGSGSDGVSSDAEDYLYLLSTREIGYLDRVNDNRRGASDTNVLGYYSETDASRIKYDAILGKKKIWWLRSANSSYDFAFYIVLQNGTTDRGTANFDWEAAPAFRILD